MGAARRPRAVEGAPRGGRAASSLAADPVLRGFVLAWLAVTAPYLVYLWGGRLPLTYRDSWTFVLLGAAVTGAAMMGGFRAGNPEESRLQGFVAGAFAVWAFEELLELRFSGPAFFVLHDALFVLFYVLFGFTAIGRVQSGGSRQVRLLRRLARVETALFAIGLLFYFVVVPFRLSTGVAEPGWGSAVLYVTLDACLIGLFALRLYRSSSGRDRRRWCFMGAAATFLLATDALFLASLAFRIDLDSQAGLNLLWFVPHIFVVLAVRTPSAGAHGSGAVAPSDSVTTSLNLAPAFLYAALVPVIHLVSELVGGVGSPAVAQAQRAFAVGLAALLGALAALHQVWIARVQRELRRELVVSRRRLANAVKLEAIGRLAAGVAHDFNNLLTVVVGRTDLLLSKTDDPVTGESLKMVLRAARRAAALTSELLAVGQREIGFRRRVDVGELLRALLPELCDLCGDSIELQTRLANEPLEVAIDPLHLERVARNLAANARDAMPDGGVLTLTTGRRLLVEGSANESGELRPGGYVEIAFRDTGVGMDEETQRRLFEPFFTTKALGRGAGLGLATVYGLVHQHGGRIHVESRPDEGSLFEVLFPLVGPESSFEPMLLDDTVAELGTERG